MRTLVLGIDIGGTNIKVGLVNSSGKVFARTNLATRTFVRNKTKLINALVNCLQDILQENRLTKRDILGIGVGLPGLIDAERGIVNFLVNIPGWKKVPLKKIIEKRLGIPTFIDNDVNVMTLGEWEFGAGRGIKNLVCITLGTGVGGGLVVNNEIFRGEGFSAGEIGHIPLNEKGPKCNCGGYGCLETYVGNKYLSKKGQKIFKNKNIALETITARASRGDKKAIQFWNETGTHLGNGLAGVVNVFNPTCIIIGGGIANAHKYLFKAIKKTIKKRAMRIPADMVKIIRAKLGNDAGIIGAQVLVRHAFFSKSK